MSNLKDIIAKTLKKHNTKSYIKKSIDILNFLLETNYNYIFSWKGVPIIQLPSDMVVIQEIIHDTRPDVLIECGLAHGGSILYYENIMNGYKKNFRIFGIDIKISPWTRRNIKKNQISNNITLIQRDSSDPKLFNLINSKVKKKDHFLIILDSNHSHEHVMKELNIFSKFLKKGDFIIVLDTAIEFVDQKFIKSGRNFKKGNNPYTATKEFLKKNKSFKISNDHHLKSFITAAREGFLKKIN